MTKPEQIQFVLDVTQNLRDGLLKKLPDIPDNWDGIELRRWISDYYTANFKEVGTMMPPRRRDYNNTVTIKNLI